MIPGLRRKLKSHLEESDVPAALEIAAKRWYCVASWNGMFEYVVMLETYR
jgi:hypothetical protein